MYSYYQRSIAYLLIFSHSILSCNNPIIGSNKNCIPAPTPAVTEHQTALQQTTLVQSVTNPVRYHISPHQTASLDIATQTTHSNQLEQIQPIKRILAQTAVEYNQATNIPGCTKTVCETSIKDPEQEIRLACKQSAEILLKTPPSTYNQKNTYNHQSYKKQQSVIKHTFACKEGIINPNKQEESEEEDELNSQYKIENLEESNSSENLSESSNDTSIHLAIPDDPSIMPVKPSIKEKIRKEGHWYVIFSLPLIATIIEYIVKPPLEVPISGTIITLLLEPLIYFKFYIQHAQKKAYAYVQRFIENVVAYQKGKLSSLKESAQPKQLLKYQTDLHTYINTLKYMKGKAGHAHSSIIQDEISQLTLLLKDTHQLLGDLIPNQDAQFYQVGLHNLYLDDSYLDCQFIFNQYLKTMTFVIVGTLGSYGFIYHRLIASDAHPASVGFLTTVTVMMGSSILALLHIPIASLFYYGQYKLPFLKCKHSFISQIKKQMRQAEQLLHKPINENTQALQDTWVQSIIYAHQFRFYIHNLLDYLTETSTHNATTIDQIKQTFQDELNKKWKSGIDEGNYAINTRVINPDYVPISQLVSQHLNSTEFKQILEQLELMINQLDIQAIKLEAKLTSASFTSWSLDEAISSLSQPSSTSFWQQPINNQLTRVGRYAMLLAIIGLPTAANMLESNLTDYLASHYIQAPITGSICSLLLVPVWYKQLNTWYSHLKTTRKTQSMYAAIAKQYQELHLLFQATAASIHQLHLEPTNRQRALKHLKNSKHLLSNFQCELSYRQSILKNFNKSLWKAGQDLNHQYIASIQDTITQIMHSMHRVDQELGINIAQLDLSPSAHSFITAIESPRIPKSIQFPSVISLMILGMLWSLKPIFDTSNGSTNNILVLVIGSVVLCLTLWMAYKIGGCIKPSHNFKFLKEIEQYEQVIQTKLTNTDNLPINSTTWKQLTTYQAQLGYAKKELMDYYPTNTIAHRITSLNNTLQTVEQVIKVIEGKLYNPISQAMNE